MRRLLAYSLTALFPFFSACTSSDGQTSAASKVAARVAARSIHINLHSEITSADPRHARDITTATLSRMLFEGLFRKGVDGSLVPSLAESYTISEDGKVYTFILRVARWTNGDAITAQHFEASLRSTLDPHTAAQMAYLLYPIRGARPGSADSLGVRALDAKTLEITLDQPTPYFLEILTNPIAFCLHPNALARAGCDGDAGPYSGPFILESWKRSEEIVVQKNPSYWDAATVGLESIRMMMIEDQQTELNLFMAGDLDWAGSPLSSVPTASIEGQRELGNLYTQPILGTYWFKFNTECYPFNNANIRKAFAFALSRKAIIDHVMKSDQQPALTCVPGSLAKGKIIDNGLAEARAFFEKGCSELGLDSQSFPEVILSYSTGERLQQMCQAVQSQLHSCLGVRVVLSNSEWNIHLDKMAQGHFQIAARGALSEYTDAMGLLEPFAEAHLPGNETRWQHPLYKSAIERAASAVDPDTRQAALLEAEEVFLAEMPAIPFCHPTLCYVRNQHMSDVALSELGSIDFKWATRH